MYELIERIIFFSLYFLAIINPLSKIFVLSILCKEHGYKEVQKLSIKSSIVALMIFLVLTWSGDIILKRIFHIEIYSVRIAGGIIYFLMGLKALDRGIFFDVDRNKQLSDFSIVPIASPMIAGPAGIAAAIAFTAETNIMIASISITIATLLNMVFMLSSGMIDRFLKNRSIIGALIRMTGLLVAMIAVQMIFTGVAEWFTKVIVPLM